MKEKKNTDIGNDSNWWPFFPCPFALSPGYCLLCGYRLQLPCK